MDPGPLVSDVEKKQVETVQVGNKVLKVSYTEHRGRRKKTTEIEVSEAELDQLIEKAGAAQLLLF